MGTDAISDLIERLEAAEGPDREIDANLWRVLIEKPRPGDKIDRDMIGRWPTYTASVDAALALAEKVLPGWFSYSLSQEFSGGADRTWPSVKAENTVYIGRQKHSYVGVTATGATLPLALCTAILKGVQHAQ